MAGNHIYGVQLTERSFFNFFFKCFCLLLSYVN